MRIGARLSAFMAGGRGDPWRLVLVAFIHINLASRDTSFVYIYPVTLPT